MVRWLALAALAAALLATPAAAAPKVAPAERAAITAVLDRYVPAALERKDLRLAYMLSGPQIRGGMTLREWLHGGIPVYPYPAKGTDFGGWVPTWRDATDVGLSLLIQPKKGAKIGPIAFDIQMTKVQGRWLVNAIIPQAQFAPAGKRPSVFSQNDLLPGGGGAHAARGRLSPVWFVVPAALAGLALVVLPAGYFLYARRRDARAYREYLQAH